MPNKGATRAQKVRHKEDHSPRDYSGPSPSPPYTPCDFLSGSTNREDYGEERSVLLGMTGGQLLYVAYTERGDNIRIISARRATRHEQDIYFRQNAE